MLMVPKVKTLFHSCALMTLFLSVWSCNTKQHQKPTDMALKTQATLEYKIKAQLGEGAFWNHQTQELYWVDIDGKALHIYNPKTKSDRTIDTPSRIGTVVPINGNSAVVALEDGIYTLNTETQNYSLLSDVEANIPTNRFNDGKCDPSGRLWVGSMGLEQRRHDAKLYMIDHQGNALMKKDSVTISNGIVWTKDKHTMYYIDTPTAEIKAYDYDDKTAKISNERVVVKVPDSLGFPDGMTIDEEDKLWVGMWNGNAVIRFDPLTGKVLSKIQVPAHNVTSCAFGGENLDTLFITTSSQDMTTDEYGTYPLAGSIFMAVPGVKGVKSPFFKAEQNIITAVEH